MKTLRALDANRRHLGDLADRLFARQQRDADLWSAFLSHTVAATQRELATSAFDAVAKRTAEAALGYQDMLSGSIGTDWSEYLTRQFQTANNATANSLYMFAEQTFSAIRHTWTHDFLEQVSRSAVHAGLESIRIDESDLEDVASRAVTRSIEASPTSEASSDEAVFSTLVENAWTHIAGAYPHLSQESKIALLGIMITVFFAILTLLQGSINSSRGNPGVVAGTEAVAAEVRILCQDVIALAEQAEMPRPMVARRRLSLRDEHETKSRKIGTVEAGQALEVGDLFERWLYLHYRPDDSEHEGWIYYRDLVPR